MDENDYNLALKLILKALEINEINKLSQVENDQINVSNTLNQLGNIYTHLNRYEDALIAFENGLKISPNNMALRVNAGDLYRKLQKNEKAREIMEMGIDLCGWGDDGDEYYILKNKLYVGSHKGDSSSIDNKNNNINNDNNNYNNNDNNNNKYDNNNNDHINRVTPINEDSTIQNIIKLQSEEKTKEKSANNSRRKVLNPSIIPPAALLNNLGLLELDEKNYQMALYLFEKAASIEMSARATEHSEMKGSDGDQVRDIILKNILRAKEGIENSVTNKNPF